jgi:hypothetical protein
MIMDNSVLILDGGEISGNTATNLCGGVLVGNRGNFSMAGGSVTANAGGGVLVLENGVFTMSGGAIRNNITAETAGGGVLVHGMFNWQNGEINENQTAPGGNPAEREISVAQTGRFNKQ